MAQRTPRKSKKQTASKPAPGTNSSRGPGGLEERIRDLEYEREQLARELQTAKARIAALELAQQQALNRIDWVIDSLHNLTSK